MDESVTIRDAVAGDALTLGVLATQVFLDTYATDGIRPALAREVLAHCSTEATATVLADRATQVIVAERDGHMIGFAQLHYGAPHPLLAPHVAQQPAQQPAQRPAQRPVQQPAQHQMPHLATNVATGSTDEVAASVAVELVRLYVHERFTGKGIGTALLRRSEERAARSGAPALWLTAWTGNHRARAFYARQGYDDLGATIYTFEEEQFESRLFVRRLAPVQVAMRSPQTPGS